MPAAVSGPRFDPEAIAYQLPQPSGMANELIGKGALDLSSDADWIPQADNVWFRPLILNVSQGYYVNLLRVAKTGILSRHRHSGPVQAFTLQGRWRYLEHDWVAEAGDYAFEPAGETHTLVVEDTGQDMVTLFHVTGGYTYVDPYGEAMGYEDVFTKLAAIERHYAAIGRDVAEARRFVR